MKQIITIIVSSLMSLTVFAAPQYSDDLIEVKKSLDAGFFENCLSNLSVYQYHGQEGVECTVFKKPSDSVIAVPGTFVGSLHFIVHASEYNSVCHEKKARLYVRVNENGDILLLSEKKDCLQEMANTQKRAGYPFANKSIYLKKK